ncbi:hypothetical protein EVG20_g4542 [Dentipellis fragilis]|uniref:Uncharacterized protein n=1 Tax=Dentipellis fragilis TaxID=205917 RepID=A0A4Y9YZJ0_9AGAM|nr:hypothetical protein EVG20_g4542 [Dentipellis fragilis]
MNTPKTLALGWGSLIAVAGVSFYYAKKNINERRKLQAMQGSRPTEKLDWKDRIAQVPEESSQSDFTVNAAIPSEARTDDGRSLMYVWAIAIPAAIRYILHHLVCWNSAANALEILEYSLTSCVMGYDLLETGSVASLTQTTPSTHIPELHHPLVSAYFLRIRLFSTYPMVNVRGMTAGISGLVAATGLGVYYMKPNRDPYLHLTPNEKTSKVTTKDRGAKPILRSTIPGEKHPRNQAELDAYVAQKREEMAKAGKPYGRWMAGKGDVREDTATIPANRRNSAL